MLRHAKDLADYRPRPVDQVDDDEVPQAAGQRGKREHPGATIQEEHEEDDDHLHGDSAWPTEPRQEGERQREWAQVRRLDIALDSRVQREVGTHDDDRRDDPYRGRGRDRDDERRDPDHVVALVRPRNHRKLGDGSQRSGSHSTKADHPTPSSTPPNTSLGQWAPAHTLAMHVSTITTTAKIQRTGRKAGLIFGAMATAIMKAIQVKKTACPLGKLKPVVGDRMWTRSAGGRWREITSLMRLSRRLEVVPINISQPARRSRMNRATTAT